MNENIIVTTSRSRGKVISTLHIERKPDMESPTFNTKQQVIFKCFRDCEVGAFRFSEGEPLKAVSNGMGKFVLYAEWAEGGVGTFSAKEINKLAGKIVVQ